MTPTATQLAEQSVRDAQRCRDNHKPSRRKARTSYRKVAYALMLELRKHGSHFTRSTERTLRGK